MSCVAAGGGSFVVRFVSACIAGQGVYHWLPSNIDQYTKFGNCLGSNEWSELWCGCIGKDGYKGNFTLFEREVGVAVKYITHAHQSL